MFPFCLDIMGVLQLGVQLHFLVAMTICAIHYQNTMLVAWTSCISCNGASHHLWLTYIVTKICAITLQLEH